MAWPTSDFPTSLDTISDKTDSVDDVAAADVNGAYDCIEKIEVKVGVNSSGVNTSLDYLLNNASSLNPGHKHSFATGIATLATGKAVVTGSGGLVEVSAVTATEMSYLDGVTSAIQTQIDSAGSVDISGTPATNDFARFTDVDTLEGRSYAEVKSDLDLEIGTDVLAEQTVGIANDNLLEVDGSPSNNEYAKFTANGLEGRTFASVAEDLSLVVGTNVLAEQTVGIANDNLLEVDGTPNSTEYAKFTAAGMEGRTFAEMKVDLDLEAGTDFYSKTAEDTWRSNVTQTEMSYLDGVTSDIQTQLGSKASVADPTFTGTVTAPTFNSTSRRAIKKNIALYSRSALDLINTIKVVKYNLKSDESNEQLIGFVADDTDEDVAGKEHNKMSLGNTIGVLLKAVQELSNKINNLELELGHS